jgi:hypothetical protein
MSLDPVSEKRLLELEALHEGWLDGVGDKIPAVIISAATNLLIECHHLKLAPPAIGPMEDGEISLEWDTDTHLSILVAVHHTGYEMHMIRGSGLGSEIHQYSSKDVCSLAQKVRELTRRII